MFNFVKTGILFAALTALFITVGYLIGGREGAIVFLGFSVLMNMISFWFSDRIALAMVGAKPLAPEQAPGVHELTAELSQRLGIPTPKIYFTTDPQPNAFATGRGPGASAICLTSGLINVLDKGEVAGVIAHELGHVRNYDVLISTIAAVIAGTISSLANIALWFGGDDEDRPNPVVMLLVVILAPITATLIQLAISRTREYAADATAAEVTKEPLALANALAKISGIAKQSPMNVNPNLASLYIANPLRGGGFSELFSTHPAVEKRIARLEALA
jgi:heat shock protein HtpX